MTTPPTAPGTDRTQVPMIFIVGNSRSGTTMLGRVLGRHGAIYTFEEMHFFENLVDAEAVRTRPAWPRDKALALVERLLTTSRGNIFTSVQPGVHTAEARTILEAASAQDPVTLYETFLAHETARHGKTIPCEQTPRYLFFLEEILGAFPGARVINMTRDPRAVLLSQKNKWTTYFKGSWNMPLREMIRAWANYHPIMIAKLWSGAVRTAARFEDHPAVLSIRFEDLLKEPETTIRGLCDFVGVPFDERMLAVAQVGSSLRDDREGAIGIDPSRAESWKQGTLGRFETALCEWIARDEMALRGYEPSGVRANPVRVALSFVGLGFKGVLALLLNLSRTRNLIDTIRRRLRASPKRS